MQRTTSWPILRDWFLRRLAEGASVEDIIQPHFQHLCTHTLSSTSMLNVLYEQDVLTRVQCNEIMDEANIMTRWTRFYDMMIRLNMGEKLLIAWESSGNVTIVRYLYFNYTNPQPRDETPRQRTRAHSAKISLAGGFTFLRNRTTKTVRNACPWMTFVGIVAVIVVVAVTHPTPHLLNTPMGESVTDSTTVVNGNDQEKINDSGGTTVLPTKPAATTLSSPIFPTTPSSISPTITHDNQIQQGTQPLGTINKQMRHKLKSSSGSSKVTVEVEVTSVTCPQLSTVRAAGVETKRSVVCSNENPASRTDCGWPGITEGQCQLMDCCYQPSNYWNNCFIGRGGLMTLGRSCDFSKPYSRKDCGYSGITKSQCEARNCCYDSRVSGVNHCFVGGQNPITTSKGNVGGGSYQSTMAA